MIESDTYAVSVEFDRLQVLVADASNVTSLKHRAGKKKRNGGEKRGEGKRGGGKHAEGERRHRGYNVIVVVVVASEVNTRVAEEDENAGNDGDPGGREVLRANCKHRQTVLGSKHVPR